MSQIHITPLEQPAQPMPKTNNQGHILLAQNAGVNHVLTDSLLTREGYLVFNARYAINIIDRLQTAHTDAILLDINFPELTDFKGKIFDFAHNNHIPIILICSLTNTEHSHSPQWKVSDYIHPSSHRTELLCKIKSHIQTAQLKKQLALNRIRQTALLKHSQTAIIFTDLSLNITKTNPQFCTQYDDNKNIHTLFQLLDTSTPSTILDKCVQQIQQQGSVTCEIKMQQKNGEVQWINLRGELVEQHINQELIWSLNDMSTHKADQEQQQLIATVFEFSGEAMIVMNEQGAIKEINSAMQRMTGFNIKELQHHSINNVIAPFEQHQAIEDILQLAKQRHQWKGELWLKKKYHSPFPNRIIINCINRPNSASHYFVAVLADISTHKAHEQELKHRANHDPLTGLPNRNRFFIRLSEAFIQAQQHKFNVTLLYLDLDGFKAINDALGHGTGDKVLQDVANKLTHYIREEDTVARLGGDEFGIIISAASKDQASATAQRLIDALSTEIKGLLPLSASIGIAVFPKDTDNSLKLLAYADEAMYHAKKQGKNAYSWYSTSPS